MQSVKASHPARVPATPVVRLILGFALAVACAAAPATAESVGPITFDVTGANPAGTSINELVIDSVGEINIEPVSFGFTIDGSPSASGALRYGPQISTVANGWGLEGPTEGVLTVDFGEEIISFTAGMVLSYRESESAVILATATDASGAVLEQQVFGTFIAVSEENLFAETLIVFDTPPTTRTVSFQMNSIARRFLFDNLTFQTTPRPVQPPDEARAVALGTLPEVAALASGDLVAAWLEQQYVYISILDQQGGLVYGPRRAGVSPRIESVPAVHALENGGFAVAWYSVAATVSPESSDGIYLRVFDATGSASQPPRHLAATTLAAHNSSIDISEGSTLIAVTWADHRTSGTRFLSPDGSMATPNLGSIGDQEPECGTGSAEIDDLVLLVWCESFALDPEEGQTQAPEVAVIARSFSADGTPAGDRFVVSDRLLGEISDLQVVALPASNGEPGRVVAVWRQSKQSNQPIVFARLLTSTHTLTPVLKVQPQADPSTDQPRVSANRDGDFIVTWRRSLEDAAQPGHPPSAAHEIHGRAYYRSGVAASPSQPLLVDASIDIVTYSLQWTMDHLQLVWENSVDALTLQGVYLSTIPLTANEDHCTSMSGHLCLAEERFRATVQWRDFTGGSGEGTAIPMTSDTGYFWFFQEGTADLVVKVLDGTGINGKHWVFFGSLTNVEFDLVLEDRLSGQTKTYHNPALQFASVGDTSAFDQVQLPGQEGLHDAPEVRQVAGSEFWQPESLDVEPSAQGVSARPTSMPGAEQAVFQPNQSGQTCEAIAATIPGSVCVDDRFIASCEWEDFTDGQGTGVGRSLARDTSTFWFFQPSNIELMVKILDGRSINGHFWIFYGALTDVGFTLSIVDSVTGESKSYTNPLGNFASVGDLTAFSG